jgi:DTW domain-containing protein YfiP
LHRERCVCAAIPRLKLQTRVSLIVHAKELKRTTNTGRLAVRSLVNSEMIVRGEGREAVDLSRLLVPEYRSVLFFPSGDAVELNNGFLAHDSRPLHLIVPDGNWRQASKVAIRHKELAAIPRVKISRPNFVEHHLRAEIFPSGMSTLEAIARALEVAEGVEAAAPLLALYQAKLRGTLIGRGVVSDNPLASNSRNGEN